MAEETESKAAAGGGKGGFVIALVLLAVIGAGAGAGFSLMFSNGDASPHEAVAAKRDLQILHNGTKQDGATGGAATSTAAEGSKVQVASLDPILVTLAGPQRSWARLELGVVLQGPATPDDPVLLKSMTEDIMSFMRTLPLIHVESASGVEYLRDDIEEIARLRSRGRARSIILRSLVVE